MSNIENLDNPETPETNIADVELQILKDHAEDIGLKYHHKVGAAKLRAQIQAHESDTEEPDLKPEPEVVQTKRIKPPPGTKKRQANTLIRVRVTCMNPNKREWHGEVLACGNRFIGNIKKYIPFDNPEGWHVPHILVDRMQKAKCQIFVERRNSRGEKIKQGKLIPEYNVEIMDPLTRDEMKALATQQALNHSIDRDND